MELRIADLEIDGCRVKVVEHFTPERWEEPAPPPEYMVPRGMTVMEGPRPPATFHQEIIHNRWLLGSPLPIGVKKENENG